MIEVLGAERCHAHHIREKALKSKKSIVVEMQQFDKIPRDFEGVAETHTDWTPDET